MADLPAHVALLAPVPLKHLISGAMTCEKEGKVAFGSRAFEALAKLRDLADNADCDVWIYASEDTAHGVPKVTWKARYLRFVEAKAGRHPDGMRFRPVSTGDNPGDNQGHWFIFWEVADLRKLEPQEQIAISKLKGVDKKSTFASGFVPRGPIVIEAVG